MSTTLIISIEVELGWGMHDKSQYDHLSNKGVDERYTLDKLLKRTEKLKIPVTYNVVGHLILNSCKGSHDGPYPSTWWSEDPGSNSNIDPLFYAPDIVNKIAYSGSINEIACHTFSHVLGDKHSDDVLREDIVKFQNACNAANIAKPKSIVLPRHQSWSRKELAKLGFQAQRVTKQEQRGNVSQLKKYKQHLFGQRPYSGVRKKQGIVQTISTPYPSLTSRSLPNGQRRPHWSFRIVPMKLRQYLHLIRLQNSMKYCIENDKDLHLWTHLYNMSNEYQWSVINKFLKKCYNLREDGEIQIKQMSQYNPD
jgi:hypothetical protein